MSSRQFAGKVHVVSHLFPYCTTYCPLLARDMAVLDGAIDHSPLRDRAAWQRASQQRQRRDER